jgi:very-short-patch-repair endonuclease
LKTPRARQLRENATDAENRLWYALRNRALDGSKFVRQLSIGPYFADFACREHMLIVELDGGQHSGSQSDVVRTRYLNDQGYGVLRFWNNEILENRDGVLNAIQRVIAQTPSPDLRFAPATLSPTGRGTRGARAASASKVARHLSIPLPVGERVDRPQGETGEGALQSERPSI